MEAYTIGEDLTEYQNILKKDFKSKKETNQFLQVIKKKFYFAKSLDFAK